MASIVSAGTTSATALNMSADTSGVLQLASNNGTVGVTLSTAQNLMIGSTTDNGYKLKVVGGNASNLLIDNGGQQYTQLLIQRNGTANTGGDILIDGTSGSMNIRSLLAGPMVFYTSASAGSPAEGMRISSAGYVTTPYQPCFTASISTNPSAVAGATVTFDTAPVNVGSSFNTSTYTFTAPVAGNYMFTYGLRVDGFTAGNYFHFRLLKNNATSTSGGGWYGGDYINIPSSSTYVGAYTTCILNLAANDTIKIRNDCATSAGTYLGYQCWFSGYLLG
jgi:hypothetical protein